MLAVDTETTGLDLYHGARPFLVTLCDEDGSLEFFEWDVNPLTREVHVPPEDLDELHQRLTWNEGDLLPLGDYYVQGILEGTRLDQTAPTGVIIDRLIEMEQHERAAALRKRYLSDFVIQNSKFDVAMLRALFAEYHQPFHWDWSRCHDTLIAGHLLATNKPHDLTSMALQYLGLDIQPIENALEACVKKCRNYCQHRMPDWAIARAGREDMPSAGEKTWKYDAWLPRAMAQHFNMPTLKNNCNHEYILQNSEDGGIAGPTCRFCAGSRYHTILQEYANADSQVTVALYAVMLQEMRRRGLEEIYTTRRKAMEIAHRMEWRGVTGSVQHTDEIDARYALESANAGHRCVEIAQGFGYNLTLPKSGNNNSLKHFCFGRDVFATDPESGREVRTGREEWLNLPVVRRTESGEPSLDKIAMEEYLATLSEDSVQHEFIRTLVGKRSRDTARSYIEGYRRFWLPWNHNRVPHNVVTGATGFPYFVLHPSLNPCGTDTLRWSSSHPNEQNIAKKEGFNLRYAFGPAPGREWWSLDAKNIELRIPFWMAGEKELMDLFERPDDPPYYGSNHLLNFHTVFADIWNAELGTICAKENCCKGQVVDETRIGPHCKKKFAATYYQQTKNAGFAKQYGGQRAKVDATFKRRGAFDLIDARFNKLASYNRKWILFAEKHGYVETLPDKTVNLHKGYPILCTRTDNGRILPTVPLSYHVQSTAMWWTFKAMIRVQAKLDEWNAKGFDGHITMQVHDELVLDLPKRGNPSAWDRKRQNDPEMRKLFLSTNLWRIEIIRGLMAKGGDDIGVPTPVGVEFHPVSWDTGITFA